MHHGIIPAISVEVQTVDGLGIKVFYAVDRDESAGFGIVVARFKIIQLGFRIVVIAAVTERVAVPDMACIGNVCAVRIPHRMVPPCIVPVFYHNIPAIVKKGDDSLIRKLFVYTYIRNDAQSILLWALFNIILDIFYSFKTIISSNFGEYIICISCVCKA